MHQYYNSHTNCLNKQQENGNSVFPLIEAGSQIQAGSLTEAGGSKGKYHTTNCTFPRSTVVHCVIRAYCVIRRTAGISLCSNKYETKNLGVLNNVMFIDEPGCSNRSRGLLLEEIR